MGGARQDGVLVKDSGSTGRDDERAQEEKHYFDIRDYGSPTFARSEYEEDPSESSCVDFRTYVSSV